jgi:hypothetical protein
VDVDVAMGTEAPANRAARDVLPKKEPINLGLREIAGLGTRVFFNRRGICHGNHRGLDDC